MWQYGNHEAVTTYHYHDNMIKFHPWENNTTIILASHRLHSCDNMRRTTVIYAVMMIQNAMDTTIGASHMPHTTSIIRRDGWYTILCDTTSNIQHTYSMTVKHNAKNIDVVTLERGVLAS